MGFMVLCMSLARPELKHASPVPLYMQIVDFIAESVERGDLAPGDKLPSGRDLAEEWEVGYSTVTNAVRVLIERGVLVTGQGKGTFVAEEPRD
jgi:DNA-binding GntR family transcriptional regulator